MPADPDDHVDVPVPDQRDQLGGARDVVGAVAVGHHVDVRVELREGAADHMALALLGLVADLGAGRPGSQ